MITSEMLRAIEQERVKRRPNLKTWQAELEPLRYREILAVRWLVLVLGPIVALLAMLIAVGE